MHLYRIIVLAQSAAHSFQAIATSWVLVEKTLHHKAIGVVLVINVA